jgi:hypothetical protein
MRNERMMLGKEIDMTIIQNSVEQADKLDALASQNKWRDIIGIVERMPEAERNMSVIGCYVRALNNVGGQLGRAIEVSLQYSEQGKDDPLWHYRLGYSYLNLNYIDKAEDVLLHGKELAAAGSDVLGWIDELLAQIADEKEEAEERKADFAAYAAENNIDEQIYANEYVFTNKYQGSISVIFNIDIDKILAIGNKMLEINEDAYMNGYNWEAFFNYYLPKYAQDITMNMETDSEAGTYVADYPLTPENEARAEKFVEIIKSLVENEDELYRIVRDEGDEIEWD